MTTFLLFVASPVLAGCTIIAIAVFEGSDRSERLTRSIFGGLALVCALASAFCLIASLWRAVL